MLWVVRVWGREPDPAHSGSGGVTTTGIQGVSRHDFGHASGALSQVLHKHIQVLQASLGLSVYADVVVGLSLQGHLKLGEEPLTARDPYNHAMEFPQQPLPRLYTDALALQGVREDGIVEF